MPQRKDPYKNFRFRVEIDGITQASFTEVVMPECTLEVIEYREGGDLGATRKLPGRLKFGSLILRWGSTDSRELYNWWASALNGNVQRKNISVVLLNDSNQEKKRWSFTNTWPTAYRPASFDASGDKVYIESLEIALESFELAS